MIKSRAANVKKETAIVVKTKLNTEVHLLKAEQAKDVTEEAQELLIIIEDIDNSTGEYSFLSGKVERSQLKLRLGFGERYLYWEYDY